MEDTNWFNEMMRMDFEHFKEILNLIEPDITAQEIIGGNNFLAAERFTLRIRFLAMGESFGSLSFEFCISNQAISYIIRCVCNAIVKYLLPLYLTL